jgi:hypothetical protein
MELSLEFKQLCEGFHQDVHLDVKSLDELVLAAIAAVEPKNAKSLGQYLDKLLSGEHTPEQLQEMWFKSPADIYFEDGNALIKVLEHVRLTLQTHPNFSQ